jgi:hypothetical protein
MSARRRNGCGTCTVLPWWQVAPCSAVPTGTSSSNSTVAVSVTVAGCSSVTYITDTHCLRNAPSSALGHPSSESHQEQMAGWCVEALPPHCCAFVSICSLLVMKSQ